MTQSQGVLWRADGFEATPTGLRVTGSPSLASWTTALQTAAQSRSAIQWTIGDLLLYAETRKWSDDQLEAIMDSTGLKRGTLLNLKVVARAFPPERRRAELPWSHHQLVAALADEDADMLLDQSRDLDWGWEELREHARSQRHDRARVTREFPEGTFGILVATPPWRTITAPRHVLNVDAIAAYAPQVQARTAPDALLYMTAALTQLDDAMAVMRAWGFTLRGHHVLIDGVPTITNEWLRVRHHIVLFGTRGRPVPPAQPLDSVHYTDSVVVGHQGSLVHQLEQAHPEVPKLLLFATGAREGWTAWVPVEDAADPVRGIRITTEEPEVVAV